VANLVLVAVLELGAGFVQTFKEFLALRSLFGVGMGGIWGLAAATALENLPVEARGLASGVLQEGYAVGYLLAAVINLYLVPKVDAGWRALFWTASGISLFAAAVRAVLPESEFFLKAKAAEQARGTTTTKKTKVFVHETKEMLKRHWLLCIYAVLLMTGALDDNEMCRFFTPPQASTSFLMDRRSVISDVFTVKQSVYLSLDRTYIRHTCKPPKVSQHTTRQSRRSSATVYVNVFHSASLRTDILLRGQLRMVLSLSARDIADPFSRGGVFAGTISQYIGRRLTIMSGRCLFSSAQELTRLQHPRSAHWRLHPPLDHPFFFQLISSRSLLRSIWRTGCMGCCMCKEILSY